MMVVLERTRNYGRKERWESQEKKVWNGTGFGKASRALKRGAAEAKI